MREKFSLFLLVLGAFAFFASCSDSNPVATDSENISNNDIYHYGITGVNKDILEDIKNNGYGLNFVESSHKEGKK